MANSVSFEKLVFPLVKLALVRLQVWPNLVRADPPEFIMCYLCNAEIEVTQWAPNADVESFLRIHKIYYHFIPFLDFKGQPWSKQFDTYEKIYDNIMEYLLKYELENEMRNWSIARTLNAGNSSLL